MTHANETKRMSLEERAILKEYFEGLTREELSIVINELQEKVGLKA